MVYLPNFLCSQITIHWNIPMSPWAEITDIIVSGTTVEIQASIEPNWLVTKWWITVSKDSTNCCELPMAGVEGFDSILDVSVYIRYLDANAIYYTNICAQNDSGLYCSYFESFETGDASSKDENKKGLLVYPSPATETVTAFTLKQGIGKFSMYNMAGQRIDEVQKDKCSHVFNISSLSRGIYFLNYMSGDGDISITKKFIKN